ncbi:hypothetical protein BSIN_4147 [Burkholderia singularis]|uniref:Uncharacterized protein n=1 Tax=Burkholderia singularis TaxID=1503053 RepID=A0A238H7Q4_9BURK|nr:hypothetical protein BSIN_4147 [Burkholderia singularis]
MSRLVGGLSACRIGIACGRRMMLDSYAVFKQADIFVE